MQGKFLGACFSIYVPIMFLVACILPLTLYRLFMLVIYRSQVKYMAENIDEYVKAWELYKIDPQGICRTVLQYEEVIKKLGRHLFADGCAIFVFIALWIILNQFKATKKNPGYLNVFLILLGLGYVLCFIVSYDPIGNCADALFHVDGLIITFVVLWMLLLQDFSLRFAIVVGYLFFLCSSTALQFTTYDLVVLWRKLFERGRIINIAEVESIGQSLLKSLEDLLQSAGASLSCLCVDMGMKGLHAVASRTLLYKYIFVGGQMCTVLDGATLLAVVAHEAGHLVDRLLFKVIGWSLPYHAVIVVPLGAVYFCFRKLVNRRLLFTGCFLVYHLWLQGERIALNVFNHRGEIAADRYSASVGHGPHLQYYLWNIRQQYTEGKHFYCGDRGLVRYTTTHPSTLVRIRKINELLGIGDAECIQRLCEYQTQFPFKFHK